MSMDKTTRELIADGLKTLVSADLITLCLELGLATCGMRSDIEARIVTRCQMGELSRRHTLRTLKAKV